MHSGFVVICTAVVSQIKIQNIYCHVWSGRVGQLYSSISHKICTHVLLWFVWLWLVKLKFKTFIAMFEVDWWLASSTCSISHKICTQVLLWFVWLWLVNFEFKFKNFLLSCLNTFHSSQNTSITKKNSEGLCHVLICMIYWPISFRVAALALVQSYDCPRASEVTLKDMGKLISNHNKTL